MNKIFDDDDFQATLNKMLYGDAERNIVASAKNEQEEINHKHLSPPTEIKEPVKKMIDTSTGREEEPPFFNCGGNGSQERLRAYIEVHFNLYRGQSLMPGWPVITTPLECAENLLRLAVIENDEKGIKKCYRAMELIIRENIKMACSKKHSEKQ